MIANYGYEDGTGTYYISIDLDKCAGCTEKDCLKVCPAQVFQKELNDWDEEVVAVKSQLNNVLKSCCDSCKAQEFSVPPCMDFCLRGAIMHSW